MVIKAEDIWMDHAMKVNNLQNVMAQKYTCVQTISFFKHEERQREYS
jgi:hypothetical protein